MKKIDYTDLIGMDVPDILRLAKDERWSWDKLGKALFIKNVLINDEQTYWSGFWMGGSVFCTLFLFLILILLFIKGVY